MTGERTDVRVYRALTRLYPRGFRDEYGTDLVALFRYQRADEPGWRVWARTALDLAITLPTRHLEERMSTTPSPTVPLIYLAVAVAGLLLALAGGSSATTAVIGGGVAALAGTIAAVAWNRAAPARDLTLSGQWWKFLLAGPCLIAVVIVAAGLGVEAWALGVVTVLFAVVLIAIGLMLAGLHVRNRHLGRMSA